MAKRALLKNLSDVDLRLVRIFVTVTECGGFAASELELNIGRSTISKHIGDLEMRLGLTLCHRGPSGFALTAEGAQVLRAARHLLAAIDGFQSDVDDIHHVLRGTFRLGIFDQSSTNPAAHIDRAIARFERNAPQVALEIALHSPNVLEARVLEGALDLAVVPIHRQSTSLRYDPLYHEQMTLYCGRGHALFDAGGVPDLSAHKYAGFAFNSPNMMAGRDLGLRRAARVEEEEALLLLIQSGCYLGYLADHVAATLEASGQLQRVAPDLTSYASHFAAITRKHPGPGRKTQRFLECLKQVHHL